MAIHDSSDNVVRCPSCGAEMHFEDWEHGAKIKGYACCFDCSRGYEVIWDSPKIVDVTEGD